MKKKIYAAAILTVISASALFFYFHDRSAAFKVYDEFGLVRHHFPYMKWYAFSYMFHAEVSEILDYKSFRTKGGDIVTLCGASALRAAAAKEFLKNNVHGKPVVVSACGAAEDYSGIIKSVVFYDGGSKCLNKELYDAGFIDVQINNEYLDADKWFNAKTD